MIKTEMIEISPQFFKKVDTFILPDITGTKAQKIETIYTSTIIVDNMEFDSDEDSMNRISRYVQIANYKYNKLYSEGSIATAYQNAYIDVTVNWKLADNTVQSVSIETLCKVLESATLNMTNTWI